MILCTGHSEVIDEERARGAGAAALVPKPYTPASMGLAIRRALDGRPG